MAFEKVTAIVRLTDLEQVEDGLLRAGIHAVTITKVKGYGEYKNFFSSDWMVTYAKVEVFTSRSDEVADAIMEAAHSGRAGDGIVAILPVEKMLRIRDQRQLQPGEE